MAKNSTFTRQKLIKISKQLMMSKGYNATSVNEICEIAEVTKGAFFHYFDTKEQLGLVVLNDYWQTRQQQFAESDWMEAENPLEQLERFLALVADVFMNDQLGYSCLAGSFTQELASTQAVFRAQVSNLFTEWTGQIKPVLQAAKSLAPTPHSIDIDALADYIVVVIEGALILALARQDSGIIAQQLRLLNSHLKLVFST